MGPVVEGASPAGVGGGPAEVGGGGLKCWLKPLDRVQWEGS